MMLKLKCSAVGYIQEIIYCEESSRGWQEGSKSLSTKHSLPRVQE